MCVCVCVCVFVCASVYYHNRRDLDFFAFFLAPGKYMIEIMIYKYTYTGIDASSNNKE